MDAADLTVFAAVAHAQGINKAAQALNTVQSNVTQRLRRLEEELGVTLFDRHSRGVTLTTAGAQLLPYAHRIGHLLAEARRAATNGPEPSGRLTIGSLETTTALRLPPILTAYAATYPAVYIELRTGTSASLVEEVLERRLEGAFVAGPIDHPDLVAVPIVEEELVLATAPEMSGLDEVIAEAIRRGEIKLVVFRAGCSYRIILEKLLAQRGVANLRRLELGTLDGIIGCVGAGIGVTLLPRAVLDGARRSGRVALHNLPGRQARVTTVFIRRSDAFVSTALDRFIDCARGASGKRAARRDEDFAAVPACLEQGSSSRAQRSDPG